MTKPKHRTIEHIRLFSGSAIKHYVIQADGPGAVVTLFITKEQTLEIWKQARLALMHAGEPDPLEEELEFWARRRDSLDSPPREG